MASVEPPEERIPGELHRLGTNLVEAVKVTWKRPERQKASQVLRHFLYNTLRLTNVQLEKVIQMLSPSTAASQPNQPESTVETKGDARPPEERVAPR